MSHRLLRNDGLPTRGSTSAIGYCVFVRLLLCPYWSPTLGGGFELSLQTSEDSGRL